MKKLNIFLLFILCSIIFTGCSKKEVPEKFAKLLADKSGKTIRLCFYGVPIEINPIKAAESEQDKILENLIFASPLRKTDNGKYIPYIFDNFNTRLDNGHLIIDAKWRKGLKWHDGKDFSPSEFDYTLNQMKQSDKNSPYSEAAKGIISIENTSDNIVIKFTDNSIKYLDLLCAGILPGHILDKEQLATDTVENTYQKFIEKPIGLGPYKITDYEMNYKYIQLEPNTYFYDGNYASRPQILIACSYELQQNLSDFRENLFDWISVPSMIVEQLQNLGIEDVIYREYANPAVMTWIFNTKNEKLKDVRIRKALNMLIDRDCAKQSFGVGTIEYFDNLIPIDEKTKPAHERFLDGLKLLDEIGIKDTNSDGLRDYNGNTFSINILVNNDSVSRKLIAERIVKRLNEAGIQSNLQSVSWNDFITNKLKTGNYETALLSYHISNDCSMKSLFTSIKQDNTDNLNFTGISDEELDNNLNILNSAVTNEDKNKALKLVNEKLSELCPCAFLIRPSDLALTHARGNPVQTIKSNISLWNNIYNWQILFGNEMSN